MALNRDVFSSRKLFISLAILVAAIATAFTNKSIKSYITTQVFASKIKTNPKVGFYDKTRWGDSLEQIRILYPEGSVEDGEQGLINYVVSGNVDYLENKIQFEFDRDLGLISVRLLFYQQEKPPSIFMGRAESEEVWTDVLDLLKLKYGDPYQLADSKSSDERQAIWVGASMVIKMNRAHIDTASENSFIVLVVYYSEYAFMQRHKTKGL